jgi:tripartite-type tricarboxylate transporter receptor subunit TctC
MLDRRRLLTMAALVIAAMPAAPASAQRFPDRRITMVVGFGAGGMTDVSSRMLARKLEELLGTTVIIENKAGAGGTVAIGAVAQMPADGHTLVSLLTDGPFTAAFQGRPLNLDEWAIIGGYMPQERVLFAAKSAPFNTAREMMAYAKSNPITASDGGSFWSGRVIEAFAKKHGLEIAVVPQRSGQAGSNEVMGGHVTMAETGTGTPAWSAAATPADRIERLRAAFKQAVEHPEVRAQMTKLDLTPEWIDPKTYEATLRQVAAEGEKLREYLKK